MFIEKAARVTSPVAHASSAATDTLTAIGVVASFFVGPEAALAARVMAGLAMMGNANLAGHLVDQYAMPEDCSEKIKTGVNHVFIDEPKYEAANAGPKTLTDEHNEEVKTGALHAYIENRPFSRRGDLTKCDGIIRDGSQHVYVGGPPAEPGAEPGQRVNALTGAVETVTTIVGFTQLPDSAVSAIAYGKAVAEQLGYDTGFVGDVIDVTSAVTQ
jgi:hypothetical protein